MSRAIAIGLLCLLVSCTRPQIEHLSSSFNEAIANSSSEQLLLNAVRSSLDLSMSFTSVSQFTGNGGVSGSLTPKVPFGPGASKSYDLGPSIKWDPGITSVVVDNTNIGKANDDLNKDLEYSTVDRYLRTGDNYNLLLTIMFDYFEVHEVLLESLIRQKKSRMQTN